MPATDRRLAKQLTTVALAVCLAGLGGFWAWRSHARHAQAAPADAMFVLAAAPVSA